MTAPTDLELVTTTDQPVEADADRPEPVARPSLHEEAVGRLRDMIVQGMLAPGSRVPERILCERLGISRTPLREALKVLAIEGLVELNLNRGATIAGLTVAAVDEDATAHARKLGVVVEALERVRGDGLTCLDLDGEAVRAEVDEDVHLVAVGVAPEVQRGRLAVVEEELSKLGDDEVLEDGAPEGVGAEVLGAADAEEVAEQARIDEVELGALDEALAEALVVGPEQVHDIARP